MTADTIEKFTGNIKNKYAEVNIHFKGRLSVTGIFIQGIDYAELKEKNFWRIVSKEQIETWKKTRNVNLTRLYNGMTFSRLTLIKES